MAHSKLSKMRIPSSPSSVTSNVFAYSLPQTSQRAMIELLTLLVVLLPAGTICRREILRSRRLPQNDACCRLALQFLFRDLLRPDLSGTRRRRNTGSRSRAREDEGGQKTGRCREAKRPSG